MIVLRRRLIYWLLKEYLKKWRRTIFLFFVVGVAVFFSLRFLSGLFITKIPLGQRESIGMVGSYSVDSLPMYIKNEVSRGLTSVSEDGNIIPDIAKSWKIENDGKTYAFTLREDIKFSDGSKLTSSDISYIFSDVLVEKPDKQTIIFRLKEVYAPFLLTVSRPIFKKGFVGVGEYKVKEIRLNGNFVETLSLVSVKNQFKIKTYQFYPSFDALKATFVLGEVSKVIGLMDIRFKNSTLASFPNVKIIKTPNYSKMVTLFYNTQDKVLSDKKIRSSLSYAIPDTFSNGERIHTPFFPKSWASQREMFEYKQDFAHARILLSASDVATSGASLPLELKTLPKYQKTAEEIAGAWKEIGVKTKITIVNSLPTVFQVFLGDFNVSKDPDQYTLWHSRASNNITNIDNKRIDKLLEDGRKTIDLNERIKIYADFQKYLLDDAPASFLYFPYEYEVSRK